MSEFDVCEIAPPKGPIPQLSLTPAEVRARNGRNIAIALGLVVFVILVFVVTVVRLKANVAPAI